MRFIFEKYATTLQKYAKMNVYVCSDLVNPNYKIN